jgi:hypothetical protein
MDDHLFDKDKRIGIETDLTSSRITKLHDQKPILDRSPEVRGRPPVGGCLNKKCHG